MQGHWNVWICCSEALAQQPCMSQYKEVETVPSVSTYVIQVVCGHLATPPLHQFWLDNIGLIGVSIILSILQATAHVILTIMVWGRYNYYSHFTNGESRVQWCWPTCLRSARDRSWIWAWFPNPYSCVTCCLDVNIFSPQYLWFVLWLIFSVPLIGFSFYFENKNSP